MNQTEIDELRRLHEAAGPGEAAALIPAVLHALHALLDAAEERDALLRIINDSFLSLNNPTSTLAFDGRNLVPHVEEASRYAEILRLERDALKAKLAALVEATAEVHEKLRINADGKATVTVGKAIALRRELGEALAAAKQLRGGA